MLYRSASLVHQVSVDLPIAFSHGVWFLQGKTEGPAPYRNQ